jgi:D-alanyl-D-alanine carboxypeptidase
MSTGDVLRVGSITKTFTATVILQLAQQGKLSLNDALSKYEPQIPHASGITIRELLNHTSGLVHGGTGNSYFQHPQQSPSAQQVIANAVAKPLLSPPGKAYHYSDVGYLLLGEVAQKVTGTDIGTLIQRQILTPLGLHHTVYAPGTSIPSPAAHGYVTQKGKQSDTVNWDYAFGGSAGSMASTLSDLEIWAPALATGKGILSPAMQQQRLSGMVNVTGAPGVTYGLGVFEVGGFLGHDGEVPGYNSVVLYSPQKQETAIVLGNTSPIINIPQQPNLESFPNMLTALSQALGG